MSNTQRRPYLLISLMFMGSLLIYSSLACKAEGAKSRSAVNHKPVVSRKLLVPPPPPEMPLFGGEYRQSSTNGIPLDYMSKTDLNRMKTRLETQLLKLHKENDEREQALAETKHKIEEFESFYKEGVISRRELEMKKREFTDIKQSGTDLQDRLQDTTIDLDRVKKQLAAIEKRELRGSKAAANTKSASVKPNVQAASH